MYTHQKTALSALVSFWYSDWNLPNLYFSTAWILWSLCIPNGTGYCGAAKLYVALITVVLHLAQGEHYLTWTFPESFNNLYLNNFHTAPHIFCKAVFINTWLISSVIAPELWLTQVRAEEAWKKSNGSVCSLPTLTYLTVQRTEVSYSWTLWICTNKWLGNPLPTAELCESVSKLSKQQ